VETETARPAKAADSIEEAMDAVRKLYGESDDDASEEEPLSIAVTVSNRDISSSEENVRDVPSLAQLRRLDLNQEERIQVAGLLVGVTFFLYLLFWSDGTSEIQQGFFAFKTVDALSMKFVKSANKEINERILKTEKFLHEVSFEGATGGKQRF
jgi:hypothetical protein